VNYHPVVEAAAAYLKDVAHPVIVELGCNSCSMGRQMVEAMRRPCAYFGVEGDPRAAQRAREPTGLPAGGVLLEAVVADMDGPVMMRLSQDREKQGRGMGSSTALKPIDDVFFHKSNFHWMEFPQQVEVPGYSLDSLAARFCLSGIDLLWADIEGSEAKMLAGAKKTLPGVRLLYLEVWAAPLYEGQVPRTELLPPLLASGWAIEYEYDANHVLLRNTEVRR
jgi:FkbM family methyltransferase